MKPLVNQNSPVSINSPVPVVSDMGEGLSVCPDIGDAIGHGDFGDGNGNGDKSGLGSKEGGGSTLEGTFYDLKKYKNGKLSELKGGAENQDAVIAELASFFSSWNKSAVDKYYQGKHHLYASSWYLPVAKAEYGPIAFGVGDPKEKDFKKWECEPSAWLAVYRGEVVAPKSGYFRFIGTGDDFLRYVSTRKPCWMPVIVCPPDGISPIRAELGCPGMVMVRTSAQKLPEVRIRPVLNINSLKGYPVAGCGMMNWVA